MIEVTVISSVIVSDSATDCSVTIANCDTRYIDTMRLTIGAGPARFTNIPPGMYYIVMTPEGDEQPQSRLWLIDGTSAVVPIRFDIAAINPAGKIIAIVLVGDQHAPGINVMIKGEDDGYTAYCMTDAAGIAEFEAVPENQAYVVTAYHGSTIRGTVCDLRTVNVYNEELNFPM